MADVDWEIRIRGRGQANNNNANDADKIGKTALNALITAGHEITKRSFRTTSGKDLSD